MATDPKVHPLHRFVAIKVIALANGTCSDPVEYKKKVLKEVRLHKVLKHSNILRLLDWSEQGRGESVWIVLEFAHGGCLVIEDMQVGTLTSTL